MSKVTFSARPIVDPAPPTARDDSEVLYELIVFPMPRAQFWVHELTGHEALSELFCFDVTVSTEELLDGVIERALIGQRAALVIRAGTVPRVVRGVVAAITVVRRHPVHHRTQYRFRIVPRLWFLSLKRRSRIFQHQRVDQIVTSVLREAGVESRWLLEHEYPPRVYCTQYEETDLEFVLRLLAEAGIYFHVASPPHTIRAALAALTALGPAPGKPLGSPLSAAAGSTLDAVFGKEAVVFSDAPLGYTPIEDASCIGDAPDIADALEAPKLHYLAVDGTTAAAHDKITRFEATREVVTTASTYQEYDPSRPEARLLKSEGQAVLKDAVSRAVEASVAARPIGLSADAGSLIGAAVRALSGIPQLEYYDHHGPFLFPDWAWGSTEPSRILRQERRRRHHAEGTSLVPAIHVGHKFALVDHPLEHVNAEYAIVAVRHRGRASTRDAEVAYENEFECVPTSTTYCPPRPRRRSENVVLTARVVGPPGQEVFTDELGQVKVEFHWDRESQRDERSSCWLRTMQAWAGTGWGTQFIPRIGMEVVVVFEGGDPDKPICLGALSNGTHPPPFHLPENRTRSGIRTRSTPNSGGFNELSFEDKAQSEKIYLHAQRDLDEVVLHNHTVSVGVDQTLHVGGNRADRVENDVSFHVGNDLAHHTVGDAELRVGGNRTDIVSGQCDARIAGMLSTRIEGGEFRFVEGNARLEYAHDLTRRITGNETVLVGRDDNERSYQLHVEGVARVFGTRALELASDTELVLRCGESSIRLAADRVEIDAPAVAVRGGASTLSVAEDGLAMATKDARAAIAENRITVATDDGALVALGEDVRIDGMKILLNSPDRPSNDPPPEEPVPLTTILLTDAAGNPLPHQRYRVRLNDGSERSGMTDSEGKAALDLPEDGVVYFPELSDVEAGG